MLHTYDTRITRTVFYNVWVRSSAAWGKRWSKIGRCQGYPALQKRTFIARIVPCRVFYAVSFALKILKHFQWIFFWDMFRDRPAETKGERHFASRSISPIFYLMRFDKSVIHFRCFVAQNRLKALTRYFVHTVNCASQMSINMRKYADGARLKLSDSILPCSIISKLRVTWGDHR